MLIIFLVLWLISNEALKDFTALLGARVNSYKYSPRNSLVRTKKVKGYSSGGVDASFHSIRLKLNGFEI